MNAYIKYLRSVWDEIVKLPPEARAEKMKEFSHPPINHYIQSVPDDLFGDEKDVVYCDPTPRGLVLAWEMVDKAKGKR